MYVVPLLAGQPARSFAAVVVGVATEASEAVVVVVVVAVAVTVIVIFEPEESSELLRNRADLT